jgi:hypothetical protein
VLTGSGEAARLHVLLPEGVSGVTELRVEGQPVDYQMTRLGSSFYANFTLTSLNPQEVVISY